MKLFSLILSIIVFFISLYFLIIKLPYIYDANDVIYIALLIILKAICIVGIIINWGIFIKRKKSKVFLFANNNYSKKKSKR